MITDPTAINLFYVNLEGVRAPEVNDETTIPEVHVEVQREQFHQHRIFPERCVSDNGAWTLVDCFQTFRGSSKIL